MPPLTGTPPFDSIPSALPLEIWSSFIFPLLPTLQDRLNCAHTCQTWRPCALHSVERLLLPNVDKKVKRRMPEEHTTKLNIIWHQSSQFRGCAAYQGRACVSKSCGFAGSEERYGFCSQCFKSASTSSDTLQEYNPSFPPPPLSYLYIGIKRFKSESFITVRGSRTWKAQKEQHDQQFAEWHGQKKQQTALYNEEWKICIVELERTLPLFSCLKQLETNRYDIGAPLISIDLVASMTSLRCLVLRKVHIEDENLIKIVTPTYLFRYKIFNIFFIGDGLPNLIHLELNGYDGSLTNHSIGHLSKLSHLRSFELTT